MPHGNSKKKKTPYVRTWESIRDQLKIVAGKMIAREAVRHAITDGLGGLQSCVGLGQVIVPLKWKSLPLLVWLE